MREVPDRPSDTAEKQSRLRRKWRRRRIRRGASLRLARLLFGAVRSLPLGLAADLGALAGRGAGALLRTLRGRARDHLEIAFGGRITARERDRIVSRLFAHLGRSAFEYAVYTRLGARRVADSLTALEGEEHLRIARAQGRGALCVTPHFGLWEILPVLLIARGYRGCVVGVRMRFEPVDRLVQALRAGLGVETVHQAHARELLRRIRSGELIGILPDQDMNRLAGAFLPFFGREAFTPTGPATLAWAARCPLLPMACRRVGRHHHRIEIGPAIDLPRDRPREDWIRDTTAAVSRAMEAIIASDPSQWVWFHRRWHTTPEELARKRARRARTQAQRTRHRIDTGDVPPG